MRVILGMFRVALQMLAAAALIYGVFFVPIGRHTFYRHAARISETPEARELEDAVVVLVRSARDAVAKAK